MSSYSSVDSMPAMPRIQSSVARRVHRPCAVHAGSGGLWAAVAAARRVVTSLSEELYEESGKVC